MNKRVTRIIALIMAGLVALGSLTAVISVLLH